MSAPNPSSPSKTAVECVVPILRVADLGASLRYYVDVLGFRIDWVHDPGPTMASISWNGRAIMLCHEGQGHPGTWVWIGVEDIKPLFETFRARGATIHQQPTNYSWAYEMRISDPDGHVLRFGSEPLQDQPVSPDG